MPGLLWLALRSSEMVLQFLCPLLRGLRRTFSLTDMNRQSDRLPTTEVLCMPELEHALVAAEMGVARGGGGGRWRWRWRWRQWRLWCSVSPNQPPMPLSQTPARASSPPALLACLLSTLVAPSGKYRTHGPLIYTKLNPCNKGYTFQRNLNTT